MDKTDKPSVSFVLHVILDYLGGSNCIDFDLQDVKASVYTSSAKIKCMGKEYTLEIREK